MNPRRPAAAGGSALAPEQEPLRAELVPVVYVTPPVRGRESVPTYRGGVGGQLILQESRHRLPAAAHPPDGAPQRCGGQDQPDSPAPPPLPRPIQRLYGAVSRRRPAETARAVL